MTPVSIILDDLEITKHVYLTLDKNIGFAADEFEFEIENSGERYTDLFYDTAGEKLGIKFAGAITFAGQVDSVDFPVLGPRSSVLVRGRDHTGKLCDALVDAALVKRMGGKTSSQIVKLIADSVSFPSDPSDTSQVWSEENLLPEGASLWSVVVDLAKREGFDAWVNPDKTIHFRPRALSSTPKRVYDLVRLRATAHSPRGSHSLSLSFAQDKLLSRGLKVMVIGYDPKTKKGHKVESKLLPEAPSSVSGSPSLLPSLPGRDTQRGRRPGEISYTAESSQRNSANYQLVVVKDYSLDTRAKCLARAEALLREYSAGLIQGSLSVPGDSELEINDCIQITGCRIAERTGGKYYVVGLRHEHSAARFETTIQFASKVLTENLQTTESVP